MEYRVDERAKRIARKLRKIRELKGLTREKFCEPLGENSDYWGLIERGEQPISLPNCSRYARFTRSLLRASWYWTIKYRTTAEYGRTLTDFWDSAMSISLK